MNAPEQVSLDGVPEQAEGPHLIARVSAVAVKLVFPFAAVADIRFYLNGINLRPLEDGSVMVTATDTSSSATRTASSRRRSSSASRRTR